MSNTMSVKTILVLCIILGVCYADGQNHHVYYKKKHHRHHKLYHLKYLSYLAFLAIKLKIVFFLGTVFTISAVAAKIFGVIRLMEYYKHKTHHEEKIVYVNPHDHYDGSSLGGYSYSGYSAPVEFSSKDYSPDFSIDHPPSEVYGGHERYTTIKSNNGRQLHGLSDHFNTIVRTIRRLNITDMALKEMGIKEENCKKKFICEADYNCKHNPILETAFHLLRDNSYQRYKANSTIGSLEDCSKLYHDCTE